MLYKLYLFRLKGFGCHVFCCCFYFVNELFVALLLLYTEYFRKHTSVLSVCLGSRRTIATNNSQALETCRMLFKNSLSMFKEKTSLPDNMTVVFFIFQVSIKFTNMSNTRNNQVVSIFLYSQITKIMCIIFRV